jgi:hypothetical protein
MSTPNRLLPGPGPLLLAAAGLWAMPAMAQLDQQSTMHVSFPQDSPIEVVSAYWGDSSATPRGGAMVLDLHSLFTLRNASQRRIRAVTLQVTAQEVTPGGKGSTTVCSLNVGRGEAFPVRVDLRLLRPLHQGTGPLVEVGLDGVLFADLSFYGPNKLNSRRSMTGWEMEARRDRDYFKKMLAQGGEDALRREIVASLARSGDRARNDLQLARLGRATALDPERAAPIASLELPDAPVTIQSGSGKLAGDEVRAPRLELHNRSNRAVRFVEVGWAVRDHRAGNELAGMLPTEVQIAPGGRVEVTPGGGAGLRVTRQGTGGGRVDLESVYAFVSSVEYDDGKMWIPSREAVGGRGWSDLIAPSPEEQRLAELYRAKGIRALIEELNRF